MGEGLRIRIQNFQSILDQTFEFESLTSIVGPTDRGKSAVIRALESVLYDVWEESFLRRGTKKCTLTVTFPERYPISQVRQEKGKGINSYNIKFRDGRKDKFYPKINKKIPDEVKALGFEIIETERGDKFNLNFHGQYDPLFLVVQPEPLVTSFFNSVFKITKYEGALRKLTSDNLKLNKDYKENEDKLEKKRGDLENTEKDHAKVSEELNTVNNLLKIYDQDEIDIEKYKEGIEKLDQLHCINQELVEMQSNYLSKVNVVYALTKYVDSFRDYGYLTTKIADLKDLDLDLQNASAKKINLENVSRKLNEYLITFEYYINLTVDINKKVYLDNKLIKMLSIETDTKQLKQSFDLYFFEYQNYCNIQIDYDKMSSLNECINGLKVKYSKNSEVFNYLVPILECRDDLLFVVEYKDQLVGLDNGLGVLGKGFKYNGEVFKYLTSILECKDDLCSIVECKDRLIRLDNDLTNCFKNNVIHTEEYNKLIQYEEFMKSIVEICPLCESVLNKED